MGFTRGRMPTDDGEIPRRRFLSFVARGGAMDRIARQSIARRQGLAQPPAIGQARQQTRNGQSSRSATVADEIAADPREGVPRRRTARIASQRKPAHRTTPDGVERALSGAGARRAFDLRIHPRSISEAIRSRNARLALRRRWKRSAGARNTSGVCT